MGTIRDLHEAIDVAMIESFVNEGREEDLQLDFKTTNSTDFSNRDDRKTLATAISGFANSSGGLIIWGVEAKPNRDNTHFATAKKPIAGLRFFLTKLNEFTGGASSPIVDGVISRVIDSGKDEGYGVTLVPESQSGPHMAKHGEDRYYKRSGSSFYRMEHFDIEDMFGRRAKPVLDVAVRIAGGGGSTSGQKITHEGRVVLSLMNKGRSVARYPYLEMRPSAPYQVDRHGLSGAGQAGLPRISDGLDQQVLRFGSHGNFVLHPAMAQDVVSVMCTVEINQGKVKPLPDLTIQVALAAEGFPLCKKEIIVQWTEIVGTLVPKPA